jgi:hypothetical protein
MRRTMGAWCQLWTVCSTRRLAAARLRTRPSSSRERTRGFSQNTCTPRVSASSMSGAWLDGGVQMATPRSHCPQDVPRL